MGKIKYLNQVKELFNQSQVVSLASLKKIVPQNYLKLLLNNLIKKQKIYRLTKGFYSKSDDPTLLVYCIKPSYLGLQEALSIHNIWEQETITVLVTPTKVRIGIRELHNTHIIIHNINKNYFFGFNFQDIGNLYIPVSDLEKTFIDLIYFNQKLDLKTWKQLKKKLDSKKLNKYLKVYQKKIKYKILKKFNEIKLKLSLGN